MSSLSDIIVLINFIFVQSVVVKLGVEFVEIIDFGESLARSRRSQELDVLVWIVLAQIQLVYLLFAGENVGIALEKALLEVVENGET